MSKNNQRLLNAKMENKKQRFALRKLSIGVASVLLGTTLTMIGGGTQASASVNDNSNSVSQTSQPATQVTQPSQPTVASENTTPTATSPVTPTEEQGSTAVYFKTRGTGSTPDQQVDMTTVNGTVGSTQTVNVPDHYNLANGQTNTVTINAIPTTINGRPNTLQIPVSQTIYVTPIQSTFRSVIRYVDSNNQTVGVYGPDAYVDLNGEFISNADAVNRVINSNVPNGYRVAQGNVDGTTPFNFGDIVVHVMPNTSSTPTTPTTPVNGATEVLFMDGNNQVDFKLLNGHVGDHQDVSAPAGYKFVSGHEEESVEIKAQTGFAPESKKLQVTPIDSTVHNIIVKYVTEDGRSASIYTPRVTVDLRGEFITNTDDINRIIDNNVPEGYVLDTGHVSSNVPFDGGDIIVYVKPGQTPARPATTQGETLVVFMDNDNQVGLQLLSGTIGDMQSITLPAGYVLEAGQPTKVQIFKKDGYVPTEVKVQVLPIPSSSDDTPADPGNTNQPTNPTQPSDHNNAKPDNQNQGQHENQPADQHQQAKGNKSVDHEAKNASNGQVKSDALIAGHSQKSGSTILKSSQSVAAKTNQAKQKKLPQTGNDQSKSLIGLGIASALTMFGLAGVKKFKY